MSIITAVPVQTSRLLTLPPDVLLRLLVHMEFDEVGRLAPVCRTLHSMVPVALYLQIHHEQQNILSLELHVRGTSTPLRLQATVFDPVHKVIEFRDKPRPRATSTDAQPTHQPQLRTGDIYKLQFQPWQPPIVLTDRADDGPVGSKVTAQKLFHERYHPFAETEYRCRKGYVGDERVLARWRSADGGGDASGGRCELVWLRVSLAYILAGKCKSPVLPEPMYPERVREFQRALAASAHQADYHSEDQIYLAWLAGDIDDAVEAIVRQVSPHPSRRQQLERQLHAHGISPTMLWKYGFARRFIQSSEASTEWTLASVAERIIAAETAPTNPHAAAHIAQQTTTQQQQQQHTLNNLIQSAFGRWWTA
ncbi:hypothetical protein SYNPS1DRAFT_27875 [Syncephalis pseudoplumigaleata]|uniref:F-box domain-containing protein n=1 Tax=Syncephalis pseudoplumigaleata TaxID=1712513 RepID=A0A4P9Z1V4_9FUNG|nr:hypothetical protein SYNPS1DRAFT_27875 [Syncephalis pseudoplumigaleata]|eukprot:RKP26434.1 hypothetical protein SYNPS1DRAFT_27875 [Syncephalis pseudoplumigaleata]